MLAPEIAEYYRSGGERTRLEAGLGRLEFLRTRDVLDRTLPPAPATVLDVGGATGVYAGPLAAGGYRVHVVDPLPEHAAAAAELPGVTAAIGDARELPVADASADAVLLLGPLYHLLTREDRVAAWREAARAARPGGVVLAAVINRFASLFGGFVEELFADPLFRPLMERALDTGVHRNVTGRPYFTSAYFHRPDEIVAEAARAGLVDIRLVAVETPLWIMGDSVLALLDDPQTHGLVMDMARRIEREPSMLGAGSHILAIADKPDTGQSL
jgi:SAM-dependent methyltransferase